MRVIETWIASKSGRIEDGEDAIFANEHFAAVIDGVTQDQSPGAGRIAAERVVEGLRQLPPGASMEAAIGFLTEVMARHPEGPSGAACAAIYSAALREVWLIGDCQILLGDQVFSKPLAGDATLRELRAMVLEAALLQGGSVPALRQQDPGRAAIAPFLELQRTFANRAEAGRFAYAVLDGTPVPHELVQKVPVPSAVTGIVLATDGYPVVASTLAATEAALAALLKSDPLCIREHFSTKGMLAGAASFDDRAYLRLEV